jgi:hypothetical protein
MKLVDFLLCRANFREGRSTFLYLEVVRCVGSSRVHWRSSSLLIG